MEIRVPNSADQAVAAAISSDQEHAASGREIFRIPSDVADQGKIRLGGAFRLPLSREV